MDISTHPPFFSIITPLYNREDFISETIQSVLQQSFTSWELIIIDDGSTDNSASIVQNFCRSDQRIRLLQQTNKKQPAARNLGMKEALGKWIAFIDSDDLWLSNKLEVQYQCINKNENVDVVFSDGYTRYQGKPIRLYYHYEVAKGFFTGLDLYKKLLFGNCIPILSLVIKRSWISKVGLQDETVPGVEDHDYCLRLCLAQANFYGLKDRLFEYRVHNYNFSANELKQNYLSAIIRLKTFNLQLLNNDEKKRFIRLFEWYFGYFKQNGKIEWAQELKLKFDQFNIPPVPLSEKIADKYIVQKYNLIFGIRDMLKNIKYLLIKLFYFIPKRTLSYHHDRIFTRYTHWVNIGHIKNPLSLHISSTAKINFYSYDNTCLDVQSMFVGDFTRINLIVENSQIIGGSEISVFRFCNFNISGQLFLGNNVVFNNYSTVNCHNEIAIGDNTWFGEGVRLYDHNHQYKDRNIPFTQQGYTNGKIQIGNNVWVGSNTIILKDVSIGDGCVIGANNLIYKSLPPNSIVKSRSMEQIESIK